MDAYINPAIVPVGVTPAVQFEIIPFYRHFLTDKFLTNKQKCTQTFVALKNRRHKRGWSQDPGLTKRRGISPPLFPFVSNTRRGTEVVITEQSWKLSYRNVPWVRIPPPPPIIWRSTQVAIRGSPAKGVDCVKRCEGSNPSFSAILQSASAVLTEQTASQKKNCD